MGERLFWPTATTMATISPRKAAAGMQRETHPTTSQTPKPARPSTADTGRKLSGTKTPDRSRDPNISARQPPRRYVSTSSSWNTPSGTTETPSDDGYDTIRSKSSGGHPQAPPEDHQTQGIPTIPSTKYLTHLDPPPLKDEEDQDVLPTPLSPNDLTPRIERLGGETEQSASPRAHSNMNGSPGSIDDESLFYFTAASALSMSTQESYWGLESTDGGRIEEKRVRTIVISNWTRSQWRKSETPRRWPSSSSRLSTNWRRSSVTHHP
jgi:hypothetical protein